MESFRTQSSREGKHSLAETLSFINFGVEYISAWSFFHKMIVSLLMCVRVNGNFSLVYFVNALKADDLAIREAVSD